jgi:hypothetical protein
MTSTFDQDLARYMSNEYTRGHPVDPRLAGEAAQAYYDALLAGDIEEMMVLDRRTGEWVIVKAEEDEKPTAPLRPTSAWARLVRWIGKVWKRVRGR